MAKINKDDLYFPAIVGIDGPWRIEHRDAVTQRETGTRPDLAFDTRRQRDGDAGRDHGALAWRDDFGHDSYWAVELGKLIATRGADELWPLVASR